MSSFDVPQFFDHRACKALTGLTLEQLPRDSSIGRVRQYDQGSYIWQTGDLADRVYFLQRGHVAIAVNDPQGGESTLQSITPGEAFGELCYCSVWKGQRQTVSRAIITSEVVEILLDDFVSYLQGERNVLTALMVTFCLQLSDADRQAELLSDAYGGRSHRSAEERLGRLLLQLARTQGRVNPQVDGQATLYISCDELAQMAAMSQSHVTVTMGRLRCYGLVIHNRNQLLTVNVPALNVYLVELDAH